MDSVIPRNRGIHGEAPRVDAAGNALARLETLLAQPIHDIQTANAMMAVDDQGSFVGARFEGLDFGGHRAHRDQRASLNACLRVLMRLAHVNEVELLTGVEAELHFLGRDFYRKRQSDSA